MTGSMASDAKQYKLLICQLLIPEPDPPTNIVLRQISNRRVQATWTPPAGFSGATYRVYINTMDVNTGGTEVTGTTYTTETITTSTVTIRVRASTYLSVQAVSETLTITGKDILTTSLSISNNTASTFLV